MYLHIHTAYGIRQQICDTNFFQGQTSDHKIAVSFVENWMYFDKKKSCDKNRMPHKCVRRLSLLPPLCIHFLLSQVCAGSRLGRLGTPGVSPASRQFFVGTLVWGHGYQTRPLWFTAWKPNVGFLCCLPNLLVNRECKPIPLVRDLASVL